MLNSSSQSAHGFHPSHFINGLIADLERGDIEVVGYPDVAIQVQQALLKNTMSAQQLAKLVGAEPMLSSRVLRLANSAAMNRRGDEVTELRTAVARLGTDALRSAVTAYAMAQVRAARSLGPVAVPMSELWESSVKIAALCRALARRHTKVDPDEAMLAGLLHGVGKLYILIKASCEPELLADAHMLAELTGDWHATVGRSLLEQWEMPATLINAVTNYEFLVREQDDVAVNVTDLLCASAMLASYMNNPDQLDVVLDSNPALARLGISATDCRMLLSDTEREFGELQQTLGM